MFDKSYNARPKLVRKVLSWKLIKARVSTLKTFQTYICENNIIDIEYALIYDWIL